MLQVHSLSSDFSRCGRSQSGVRGPSPHDAPIPATPHFNHWILVTFSCSTNSEILRMLVGDTLFLSFFFRICYIMSIQFSHCAQLRRAEHAVEAKYNRSFVGHSFLAMHYQAAV